MATYTVQSFLTKLKPMVIADMKQSGILASLTAAQAFIESNKGNSGLTSKANNLFGIKGTYNGQSVTMLTTEYYNGVAKRVNAAFRKYPTWAESIADHSSLFNRLARYKNLRGETDYIKACKNVQADGYATSPTYAQTLINTINKYKFNEWDIEVFEVSGKQVTHPTPGQNIKLVYPTLKRGDKSDYVLHWQKFLNINGYFCGTEDGVFGKNTEIAVKQWQLDHNLKADGIIGSATWAECLKSAKAA